MAITTPPAGSDVRVAYAWQAVAGTPAATAAAVRVAAIDAVMDPGLVVDDPQGLPIAGFEEARSYNAESRPVGKLVLVATRVALAPFLESVTAGTPVVAGNVTTFAWATTWTRFLTVWRDDGRRLERLADAVVTRLAVRSDGQERAVVEVDLAARSFSVLATALGVAGSPAPAPQWSHAGLAATANVVALSPTRHELVIEVDYEAWTALSDASPSVPLAHIRQRARLRAVGAAPLSTESAGRATAARTDLVHAGEWSWRRGTEILRVVAPRVVSRQAVLAGLSGGRLDDHEMLEELRAGAEAADIPATITLES